MTGPPVAGGLDTYNKLTQMIADYLARSDLQDQIPDFIRLVEIDLQREIGALRDSENIMDGTFNGVDDFIEMPGDNLTLRHVRVDTNPPSKLGIVSFEVLTTLKGDFSGSQIGVAAAMFGNRLYVAPTPAAGTEYEVFYRGAILPLGPKNKTNKILKDAPDCLLWGALANSAPYVGDDQRLVLWATLYERAKESYRRMEWRNRTGGGPLVIRTDNSPNDRHTSRGYR